MCSRPATSASRSHIGFAHAGAAQVGLDPFATAVAGEVVGATAHTTLADTETAKVGLWWNLIVAVRKDVNGDEGAEQRGGLGSGGVMLAQRRGIAVFVGKGLAEVGDRGGNRRDADVSADDGGKSLPRGYRINGRAGERWLLTWRAGRRFGAVVECL
jgi:hypothetical protein